MPGIRNGICNGCFLQYKGESLGRYIRERKLLLAARDLRDTDQRVYDICLKYGFDSQQTFTRVFTGPSICRRAPTVKRTTVAPTGARLPGLAFERKPATPHSAAPDTQWRPVLRTTNKTTPYKAGWIHHMECLNQLLRQRQAQRRRGQQQTGEQSQEQDPGCFYLTVKLGWDFVQPRIVG